MCAAAGADLKLVIERGARGDFVFSAEVRAKCSERDRVPVFWFLFGNTDRFLGVVDGVVAVSLDTTDDDDDDPTLVLQEEYFGVVRKDDGSFDDNDDFFGVR